MKTAVCISGRLDAIWNFDNIKKHVLDPYAADVFIDTWIPFEQTSIQTGLSDADLVQIGESVLDKPIPKIPNISEFAEKYQPKMMILDNFDAMPLTHQIRTLLPKNKKTFTGVVSAGTKTENVMFMWYKIWKCNQLRRLYEEANRVRYDRIIRLRFDSSFTEFPVIEPKHKTLYIPEGGDYDGGLNDQLVIADSQSMDLYCELYTEIYRYSYANIGIHPESMLRKHVEINRLKVERFQCGLHLRGRWVSNKYHDLNAMTLMEENGKKFLNPDNGTVVK